MDFSLRSKPTRSGRPKVTAVVGKSVFKKAVERNLLKRRLRAILAPAAKARRADIIVVAKGRGNDAAFAEIKEKLSGILKKW